MKKVLSTLGSVFIALLLIFSVVMTVMVILGVHSEIGIPTIFGHAIMSVQTDSMESEEGFNVGDLIVVKIVDEQEAEKLNIGDVVTFWRYLGQEQYLETHRIVEDIYETMYKNEVVDGVRVHNGIKCFVTRGDNTPAVDMIPATGELEYKTPTDILAVWTGTAVPKLGGIFDFLKSQTGFMLCIVVPVLLFFVYQLYIFIMTLSRKQKEKALEEVNSKEEELKQKAIAEFLAQQQAQGGNSTAPDTSAKGESDASDSSEPVEEKPAKESKKNKKSKQDKDDKPAEEKPAEEKSTEEKPAEEKSAEDKPAEPDISEEEKNRIIQEYLAKQAQEKKD